MNGLEVIFFAFFFIKITFDEKFCGIGGAAKLALKLNVELIYGLMFDCRHFSSGGGGTRARQFRV